MPLKPTALCRRLFPHWSPIKPRQCAARVEADMTALRSGLFGLFQWPFDRLRRLRPPLHGARARLERGRFYGALPRRASLSSVAGGTLGATTYYAKTAAGQPERRDRAVERESARGGGGTICEKPRPRVRVRQWAGNVYVASVIGAELRQNAVPIASGAAWWSRVRAL